MINRVKNTVENLLTKDKSTLNYHSNSWTFKRNNTLEKRKEKSSSIMKKYTDRVPVICQTSNDLPDLDNYKFLVPGELSAANLNYVIRKRIKLEKDKALYFFVGKSLMPSTILCSQLYDRFKDEDGFLYVYICCESTFGN